MELDTVYLHITSKVTDLTLPNLERVKEDVYLHANTGVETVSMPLLESVGGYLYLYQNPEMTAASFPLLVSVGEYLYADTNLSLETLDLTTSLTSVGESIYIAGNALLCVPELDWESIATDEVNIFSNAECP